MNLVTSDPAVQAAIISSVGSVLAAVIAAGVAAIIGQRFANQKKLRSRIAVLQSDLLFLWAVQQEYSRRYGDKIGVRDVVRAQGYLWSGRFSPAKLGASRSIRDASSGVIKGQAKSEAV